MTSKVFPHLWYATEAEEAARFYASVFPDSRVDRVTPLMSESPSGPPGSVKVIDFTLFGQRFQAITAGPHHEFNDAISLVVACDDQDELDRYWNALLADGGTPQACGWLIDRFGVRWQIVPVALDEMMRDADPRGRHPTTVARDRDPRTNERPGRDGFQPHRRARLPAAIVTFRFAQAATRAIGSIDTSAEVRGRYQVGLLSVLQDNSTDIRPKSFASKHLEEQHQKPFLEAIQQAGIDPAVSFAKDTSRVSVNQFRVTFESGMVLVGPPGAWDAHVDMPDEPNIDNPVQLKDEVVNVLTAR